MRALFILLAASICSTGITGKTWADDHAPVISTADATLITRAERRGRLLYAYDKAAWHGTDDLQAKLPDFANRVGGWIVDGPAEAAHLIFYSRDQIPRAVYVADFRGTSLITSKVLGAGDDAHLTPEQLAMISARQRALDMLASQGAELCARAQPNTVVLAPETPDGSTLVYILTPQTDLQHIPFGGHSLFEVTAGGKVTAPRRFMKSCLSLPVVLPQGAEFLGVSHLLDDVPTEIHVFSQLVANVPLMVIIEPKHRIYAIKSGKIERLPDDALDKRT